MVSVLDLHAGRPGSNPKCNFRIANTKNRGKIDKNRENHRESWRIRKKRVPFHIVMAGRRPAGNTSTIVKKQLASFSRTCCRQHSGQKCVPSLFVRVTIFVVEHDNYLSDLFSTKLSIMMLHDCFIRHVKLGQRVCFSSCPHYSITVSICRVRACRLTGTSVCAQIMAARSIWLQFLEQFLRFTPFFL
jgi:hypothetical protein